MALRGLFLGKSYQNMNNYILIDITSTQTYNLCMSRMVRVVEVGGGACTISFKEEIVGKVKVFSSGTVDFSL